MTTPANDTAPSPPLPSEHDLMSRVLVELERACQAVNDGMPHHAEQHRANAEMWLRLADRASVAEFTEACKARALATREPACTGDVPPTEQGAVETKFVELFYLSGGRIGLRFEGMPDIYVPDADAHRIASAMTTGGESQVNALTSPSDT